MNYHVKNVKSFPSLADEGIPFSATLYLDKKKVADCSYRGDGGPVELHFTSEEEETKYNEFVKTKTYEYDGKTHQMNGEIYLEDMVNEVELQKADKRIVNKWLKKYNNIHSIVRTDDKHQTFHTAFTTQEKLDAHLKEYQKTVVVYKV